MHYFNRMLTALLFLAAACKAQVPAQKPAVHAVKDNIKFNHLYLVLDSTTYQLLSDSVIFLKEFSGIRTTSTVTKDESWSGKYLYGKGQYLEIFGPAGYPGARIGNHVLGFMTNKLGVLDSLYHYWESRKDSVERRDRTIVDKGVATPWFTTLSLYDKDSLPLRTFLLENAREELLQAGFTKEQLHQQIDYWDYMRYVRAKARNISPDSITFIKLFEKIEILYLALSQKELQLLREHLIDFGFTERDHSFISDELKIHYKAKATGDQLLTQMNIKLTRALPKQEIRLNKLTIEVSGEQAVFRFDRH